MIREIAFLAALSPGIAMAFEPISEPTCSASNSASTVAESVAAAKCNIELTMAMAYNRSEGRMPESVFACAGITDEVMDHRVSHGPSHDSHVMLCTQAALHLGVLPPVFSPSSAR